METEMEMRTAEEIRQGEDMTSPLYPLTFALHNSFLDTHCSSCFSPLPCGCCSLPPSLSSPELNLLHSSDLRATLRLLSLLLSPYSATCPPPPPRLFGLLTNSDKLLSSSSNSDILSIIREGAREVAKARGNLSNDVAWEEAALCLVMTNAVEVQDFKSGRILGIAVYDKDFSWINHSCSPNAGYRFLLSEPNTASFCEEPNMRIRPGKTDVCINDELKQGSQRYGPRIIVRSIKPIKKGEEVTVAYTDLLQPKGMRQSELWSKYQFICYCQRCTVSPPSYVDKALEEISSSKLEFSSFSSDYNFLKDETNQILADCMDEVISEYLSVGDSESCCKKLENILTQGMQGDALDTEKGKLQLNFRLLPLHHLALNAYTTLVSAYKILSVDLLALHSDIDGHQLEALNMSRTSAAYSLLLAGATDHLFQSEPSLIASAANFWASAGESLVSLARRPEWDLFIKPASPVTIPSLEMHKCSNCSLMDRFQVNPFLSQAQNADFQKISREFYSCIINMTGEAWSFLRHGCRFLQTIKNPIDFSWLGKFSDAWSFPTHLCCSDDDSSYVSVSRACICRTEDRINIIQLGVHCLVYGRYITNICYGDNSYLACHIKNVYNE